MTEFITDGTHQPPAFVHQGVPFLFVRNIVGGQIDLNTTKHVSEETYQILTRRHRPERGDILYSAVGSFGVAVVVETDRPFTFQRHIAHLRLRSDLASPEFVAAYLNSPGGRRQSETLAMGGAQRTVTLRALASIEVPTPSVRQQRQVATILHERLAAMQEMESSLRLEQQGIGALRQALLRLTFDQAAA
jgi:type I restriction enzyme S subunit